MNALKACKDQRAWTVGKTDRNLKKSTTAWSEGMQWHLWIWCTCIVLRSLFPSYVTVLLAYDKAKILHHIELLVSNEQLGMHTQAMETYTSIASNNENGQEMEASGITHAPDLTRKCLTGINDTLPKYKMIIIDSVLIVNVIPMTQIIKTCHDFAQVFLDQLSNMAGDYDEARLVPIPLSKNKLEKNGQRGNQHISVLWKHT